MKAFSCHEKGQCCRSSSNKDEDVFSIHVDGEVDQSMVEKYGKILGEKDATIEDLTKQNKDFEKAAARLHKNYEELEKENEMLLAKLRHLEKKDLETGKAGKGDDDSPSKHIVLTHMHTKKAVVSDDSLRAAFSGTAGHAKNHMKSGDNITEEAGDGEDILSKKDHFAWVLALALPNPAKASPSRSITRKKALEAFSRCFMGEEVQEEGTLRQNERFAKEKSIFLELFDELPDASKLKGKIGDALSNLSHKVNVFDALSNFGGQGKVYGGEVPGDGKAQCFLELMRNVLVAKLVLHCGLHVRTVLSEDEESVLLLVTATAHDVLFEADRESFTAELDLVSVDPLSMEPCTRTFYPLLHWFFRHRPVSQEDPLIAAYQKVLAMIESLSEEERHRHRGEISFYEEAKKDVARIVKLNEKPEDAKGSGWLSWLGLGGSKESSKSATPQTGTEGATEVSNGNHSAETPHHEANEEMAAFLNHFKEQFEGFGGEEMFDPNIHIGRPQKVEETHDLFLKYLQLKAEAGLGKSSIELQKQANVEARAQGKKARLENLFDHLRLECFHPCRPFRMATYREGPSEWRRFALPSRNADTQITVPFSGQQVVKIVKGMIDRQIDMGQLQEKGLIFSFFPLDTREKLFDPESGGPSVIAESWEIPDTATTLPQQFVAFQKTLLKFPPPTQLRRYYGEAIALYFAFVQTITKWLLAPSIMGLITFVVQSVIRDSTNPVRVVFDMTYALTLTLWGTLVLEVWNRKECRLSVSWGRVAGKSSQVERPAFQGAIRRSPVTYQDTDSYFPSGCRGFGRFGRLARQFVSYFIILLVAIGQVWISAQICSFRNQWVANPQWWGQSMASEITGIFSSLQMSLFGVVGRALALWCNRCENYKTSDNYINNLIFKFFVVEFVNRFNVFFYIAFAKALTEGCIEEDENGVLKQYPASEGGWSVKDDAKMCLYELQHQMLIVFCIQIFQCVLQLVVPWIRRWAIRRQLSIPAFAVDEKTGQARMSHFVQHEMEKEPYGTYEVDGTFKDYTQITIIFGYVTLFSTVFPLAPALGLFLFLVEMRVDGVKLFHLLRRPLPRNTDSIGYWKVVLQFISWVSMITNTALVIWTFGAFDSADFPYPRTRYLLLIVLGLIIFKAALLLIPNVPKSVEIMKEHNEFILECLHHKQSKLQRRTIPLSSLNLSVEDINTGFMHDPLEFGVSPLTVKQRVSGLAKKQNGSGIFTKKVLKTLLRRS